MLAGSCSRERAPKDAFAEVAKASGVDFVHFNGMSGSRYFAEIMGSGVAAFDYDNDGRMDLYFAQGTMLGEKPVAQATFPPAPGKPLVGRLYHNESVKKADGTTELRFVDVTEKSGLISRGYGMGIAVGDYDNDGYPDVLLTHFEAPSQLFHNNGDGTFTDVTARSGVGGTSSWGTSATFFDYDRDGFLDLYVASYVDFRIATHKACIGSRGQDDYCSPSAFRPIPGHLFHNRGDGTFEDVSERAGIAKDYGSGLGVVAADLDRDGWLDFYVANDGNPNQMWLNGKDGTFRNGAPLAGTAVNADGAAEAGMGIDIADTSNSGRDDIFISHLTGEKATLFMNDGGGLFHDGSAAAGVAMPTSRFTGFGAAFLDYDNDGWLDIVIANGAVNVIESEANAGEKLPLHQTKQLLRNLGGGKFKDVSAEAGPAFALSEVGRGLAVADFDNDGAPDFAVSNNNGPARVFRDRAAGDAPWMGLRLLTGKRDAYGAVVEVLRDGAPTLRRRVHADGSYLSSSDPRVLVGLGTNDRGVSVRVHWPSGKTEDFTGLATRRYTTIVEGSGKPIQ